MDILNHQEKHLYGRYKSSSKQRNHPFNLSESQFKDIIHKECFYCGASPVLHTARIKRSGRLIQLCYNGIDRIDSESGYDNQNCVPCCITCNRMKLNLSIELFFDQIRKIYWRHIGKE